MRRHSLWGDKRNLDEFGLMLDVDTVRAQLNNYHDKKFFEYLGTPELYFFGWQRPILPIFSSIWGTWSKAGINMRVEILL